ncbi:hypothetical protein [Haladaptatus sp. NG-SE-30]
MQRREILKQTGAAVTVGLLAGCLGQGGTAPGDQAPDDGSDGSGDQTTTTTAEPTLKKRSFEILDTNCGNPTNEATVEFDQSNVVVTGTISGSDSCAKPVLAGAKMESGELTVSVKTKKKDGTTACSECITELRYRATLAFDGSLPKSVTVVHESLGKTKTVTTTGQGTTTSTTTTTSDGT